MSTKNNIIDVIIAKTGMKQMDIAEKLGVSRAQVSKWKKGADIPYNRRKELNEMAGLFGDDIEWSLLTKTPENAEAWIHFFQEYNSDYTDVYPCSNLSDSPDVWVPSMLTLFDKIGIKLPETAPDPDSEEDISEFTTFVMKYIESYAAKINWYDVNITSINNDDDIIDEILELESWMTDLAIDHVNVDMLRSLGADLSKVREVVQEARKKIHDIIEAIVEGMVENGIPIMIDYFEILYKDPYEMDDDEMFSSADSPFGKDSMESKLPLFERTVLKQNNLLIKLIGELHIKMDMLLKPEDKEKLKGILSITVPSNGAHLEENMGDIKGPTNDSKGSTEESGDTEVSPE